MLLPDARCGASLLVSPALDRLPRVRHGFSTLALGDPAGPPAGGIAVSRALGPDESTWRRHGLAQVHSAVVVHAGDATASDAPPEGDALVTTARGEALVVRTADCLPVLLAALGTGGVRAVAAAHAGWRGLAAGVLEATVAALEAVAPASRIVSALGPAIGPCCYEIGPEVASQLMQPDGRLLRPAGDRFMADLPGMARLRLEAVGVAIPDPQSPPCTHCNPLLFPSHRRGDAERRLASFIGVAGR